ARALNHPAYSRARATPSFGGNAGRQQSPLEVFDVFLLAILLDLLFANSMLPNSSTNINE
ncbi:MAG: hypothetical protein WBQ07_19160, partial [Candidatus Acidiferrales bacterium]